MTQTELSPEIVRDLPGARLTLSTQRATLRLSNETTDEQLSAALMLIPRDADLVSTEYVGGEVWNFEW